MLLLPNAQSQIKRNIDVFLLTHTQSLERTHKKVAHKEPKREKGRAVKEIRNKMGHIKRQSATRTKRKVSFGILYKEYNKQ